VTDETLRAAAEAVAGAPFDAIHRVYNEIAIAARMLVRR
jgi:hypothetical protein